MPDRTSVQTFTPFGCTSLAAMTKLRLINMEDTEQAILRLRGLLTREDKPVPRNERDLGINPENRKDWLIPSLALDGRSGHW